MCPMCTYLQCLCKEPCPKARLEDIVPSEQICDLTALQLG